MTETSRALAEAQHADTAHTDASREVAAKFAERDRKLAQYRATLDAGANPATVAGWIEETEAQKQTYYGSLQLGPELRGRGAGEIAVK